MKKLTGIILTLALILALAACGAKTGAPAPGAASEPYLIGISQYGEHSSLDNCRKGFLEGLAEAGLVEGEDFTVDYQNAGFDENIAIQIGQSFSSKNVDLMCAIATPSATACYAAAEDKDIPVIFTAISDPAAAHLDSGNVTGTSDKLAVDAQLDLIRKMQPDAKTIGIIYTTSEPNSVSAISEYEQKASEYGFTIDALGVTAQAEVTQATDTLIAHGVDCISNLTDNNVVGVLPSILEKTNEVGIPVYGSEVEQVKKGCVAAAGIDYVKLGRQTGAIAARVLKGEASCAEIPFETISEYGVYINSDAIAALSLTLPEDVSKNAVESSSAE